MKKNKTIYRLISIFLAGVLVFNPWLAPVVWAAEAEETGDEATVEVVNETVTDSGDTGQDNESTTDNQTEEADTSTEDTSSTQETAGDSNQETDQEENQDTNQDTTQETTSEPIPEPTQTEQATDTSTEQTQSEDSNTNTGDATMQTGDADAQADADTTTNTNYECVPGETETLDDPCEAPQTTTDCEGDDCIGHSNDADVTNEASSSATTGTNEIAGAGDATMTTGDATAGGTIDNSTNTSVTEFTEGTCDTEGTCETGETDGTPQQSEGQSGGQAEETDGDTVAIVNENEADVDNEASVSAKTGDNNASDNNGDVEMETGKAVAWANILNLLNFNLAGSNFGLFIEDLLNDDQVEVDLNKVYQALLDKKEEDELEGLGEQEFARIVIANSNLASLKNQVKVEAQTGANQANENGGDVKVVTGDAIALANVVNFVNVNIYGSTFLLAIVNVFGDYVGDIILPRTEKFATEGQDNGSGGSGDTVFVNQNQAEIDDSVKTNAQTGTNQADNNAGNNSLQTGDAKSASNAQVFANTDIFSNGWFFVMVNHLGEWQGIIYGLTSPDSQHQSNSETSTLFQHTPENQENGESSATESGQPSTLIYNNNQAEVENEINVTASTGKNLVNGNGGNTQIKTGNATALANLFEFINLNILGGRWFFAVINILGDWKGNLYFAYPDIRVGLSNGTGKAQPGEYASYILEYKNQGHDRATDVWLDFQLPDGILFLDDNSGFERQIDGQTCSWFIGDLQKGAEGQFAIDVQIDPEFVPQVTEELSFLQRIKSKLVPTVHAAEQVASVEVTTSTTINTTDPETDLTNNTAVVKTIIYSITKEDTGSDKDSGSIQESESGPGIDPRLPVLEITAWNNVGEFVYPGDVVTFEVTIKNTSDVPSFDTFLVQWLYNGLPEEDYGAAGFNIGTIEPNKKIVVRFGFKLNGEAVLPVGHYHTLAQAFGYAPSGVQVASNQARTEFDLNARQLASVFEARAKENEEEVLAAEVTCPTPVDKEKLLPYLLALIVSSMWLVDKSRKKIAILKEEA